MEMRWTMGWNEWSVDEWIKWSMDEWMKWSMDGWVNGMNGWNEMDHKWNGSALTIL